MAAKTVHSVVGVGARPQQVRSAMPHPGSSKAVQSDSATPDRPLPAGYGATTARRPAASPRPPLAAGPAGFHAGSGKVVHV